MKPKRLIASGKKIVDAKKGSELFFAYGKQRVHHSSSGPGRGGVQIFPLFPGPPARRSLAKSFRDSETESR